MAELKLTPEAAFGAEEKNYTIAANSLGVTVGVNFCATKLTNVFFNRTSNPALVAKGFGVVLKARGLSSFIALLYDVPRLNGVDAASTGSSLFATIPRSLLTGTGYPAEWRYYLGGYALPDGYVTEGKTRDDILYDTIFLYALTGVIKIENQEPTPTLVCSVL